MNQASVGFHCPECVRSGKQKVYVGVPSLRTKPVLTYVFIAISVGVFILDLLQNGSGVIGGERLDPLQFDYGLITRLAPGSGVGVGEGEWYRLVTAGFLHFGIIHLLLNMYALYVLGSAMEHIGGRGRMATVYGVSLLTGSLGALLLSPKDITAGASGAIYGLMGGILLAQRAQGIAFRDSPLIGVLVLNFVFTIGMHGNISVGGHLGGFLGGAAAGWALFGASWARQRSTQRIGFAVCAALAVASVVAAIAFSATQSFAPG